jgi:hypothetical protein
MSTEETYTNLNFLLVNPMDVKDHIVPLACGGPHAVSNLQWQTIRDAKAKDEWETKGCAR